MAVLVPTAISGAIVFLGLVSSRAKSPCAVAVERVEARFSGLVGESHSGLTRPSCSRVLAQYPRGTPIRNTRQLSILSREELEETARAMELAELAPEWLGANLVLSGIPRLTLLPPASRLIFESGVSLTIDMENAPCQIPAREIERRHPGRGAAFKGAARHRRGVTAWVEREGVLELGARARLHVPPQRRYPPLASDD